MKYVYDSKIIDLELLEKEIRRVHGVTNEDVEIYFNVFDVYDVFPTGQDFYNVVCDVWFDPCADYKPDATRSYVIKCREL